MFLSFFFFFKQKTAYEMRISDWSSDVCSSDLSFTSPQRTLNANAQLSVPLYAGGSVRNAVRAAKTRVAAGQADLRGTEASVFSQVVAAYMDVIRNSAVVALNQANERALGVTLQATGDRFGVGDVTHPKSEEARGGK